MTFGARRSPGKVNKNTCFAQYFVKIRPANGDELAVIAQVLSKMTASCWVRIY